MDPVEHPYISERRNAGRDRGGREGAKPKGSNLDHWDYLALAGVSFLLLGVGSIYWPAALILGGSGLLALYYLRERAFVPPPPAPNSDDDSAK